MPLAQQLVQHHHLRRARDHRRQAARRAVELLGGHLARAVDEEGVAAHAAQLRHHVAEASLRQPRQRLTVLQQQVRVDGTLVPSERKLDVRVRPVRDLPLQHDVLCPPQDAGLDRALQLFHRQRQARAVQDAHEALLRHGGELLRVGQVQQGPQLLGVVLHGRPRQQQLERRLQPLHERPRLPARVLQAMRLVQDDSAPLAPDQLRFALALQRLVSGDDDVRQQPALLVQQLVLDRRLPRLYAAVVAHRVQPAEPPQLLRPMTQHRHRRHHQVRPGHALLRQPPQQHHRLQRLPQTHVVREDAPALPRVVAVHPRDALLLVRAQHRLLRRHAHPPLQEETVALDVFGAYLGERLPRDGGVGQPLPQRQRLLRLHGHRDDAVHHRVLHGEGVGPRLVVDERLHLLLREVAAHAHHEPGLVEGVDGLVARPPARLCVAAPLQLQQVLLLLVLPPRRQHRLQRRPRARHVDVGEAARAHGAILDAAPARAAVAGGGRAAAAVAAGDGGTAGVARLLLHALHAQQLRDAAAGERRHKGASLAPLAHRRAAAGAAVHLGSSGLGGPTASAQ
eukprot:Rhum_TRINITY_DN21050_c0_g1::Rhum_TRINITY_DN21050_c0_g1_i1::g.172977::m.172977